MGVLSAANGVALSDKLAAEWIQALTGLGTVGDTTKALSKVNGTGGLQSIILAINDVNVIQGLNKAAIDLATAQDAYAAEGAILKAFLGALDAEAKRAALANTVNDFNSFATYYNVGAGGPWNLLFSPAFAEAYKADKGSYPAATNTYFEITQLLNVGTYANSLGKWVVSGAGTGAFTAGQAINSAIYAGGYGQINCTTGFAGSSGTVTVTGVWRTPTGTTVSGAGTATLAANGIVVIVPPVANYLLVSVSAIACAASITGGTIFVEAKAPAGRTNPPT